MNTNPNMRLVLSGYLFTLDYESGIPRKIKEKIVNNGGKVSFSVSKKTKYLVTNSEFKMLTHARKEAVRFHLPIVTEDFIDAFVQKGEVVDPKPFLVKLEATKANSVGGQSNYRYSPPVETVKHHHNMDAETCTNSKPIRSSQDLEGYELVKSAVFKGMYVNEGRKAGSSKICYCVLELHANEKLASDHKGFCVVKQICDEVELKGNNDNPLGKGLDDDEKMSKECPMASYFDTIEAALVEYEQWYDAFTNPPNSLVQTEDIPQGMGSPTFQLLQSELALSAKTLNPDVACLVNTVWEETVGELDKVLKISPFSLPLWKVEQGEAVLHQISALLGKPNKSCDLISNLSKEFYSILPHHSGHHETIANVKVLVKKKELCRLLRDIVSVNESIHSKEEMELESAYRSLRCQIDKAKGEEEEGVKKLIYSSQQKSIPVDIHNVFAVRRYVEHIDFAHHVDNKKLLFHSSSPSNFLGILSRGLLLPDQVVTERGTERRDEGLLGAGIYFADSINTCIRYSSPSKTRQTRMLVVCSVALGREYEIHTIASNLTSPPEGYDSVHARGGGNSLGSDFVDDEYAIYDVKQQYLRYLVEFSLPDVDKVSLPKQPSSVPKKKKKTKSPSVHLPNDFMESLPSAVTNLIDSQNEDTPVAFKQRFKWPEPEEPKTYDYDFKDLCDIEDPIKKVTVGLVGNDDCSLPLSEVNVRAKLVDLVGEVILFQLYKNNSFNSIKEAKYVFPLEYASTVCGFDAYVDGRHIVGKVKEKDEAHREYREAVSKGKKALLMDEETPDIFSVSVGNIPSGATVIVKITYVTELRVDGDCICFTLPSCVAPQTKFRNTEFGKESVIVGDNDTKFSLKASLEMPFEIKALWSPTHQILYKSTVTTAVIQLPSKTQLDKEGFSLYCKVDSSHNSRMWVENHPDQDEQACMISFYPEFETRSIENPEIIIAIDCSNSMLGKPFQDALKVALLLLNMLPSDCTFNILAFGSVFKEAFHRSQPLSEGTLKRAGEFIRKILPNMGNTEFFCPLRAYYLSHLKKMVNIILLSDGHLNNEGSVISAVKKAHSHVRVFPIGLTKSANKHLMRRIALSGSGFFEYLDPARKSQWEKKLKQQLERTTHEGLSDIFVKWQQFEVEDSALIQAPRYLATLYSGSHQVIYGFISNCYLATLNALLREKEFSSVVSSATLATEGLTIHRLTARSVIRDWEEGLLAEDWGTDIKKRKELEELIVKLSLKYNIVTTLTSFVAVESEKDEQVSASGSSLMIQLLKEEDVDILPYISQMSTAEVNSGTSDDELETKEVDAITAVRRKKVCMGEFDDEHIELSTEDRFGKQWSLKGSRRHRLSAPPSQSLPEDVSSMRPFPISMGRIGSQPPSQYKLASVPFDSQGKKFQLSVTPLFSLGTASVLSQPVGGGGPTFGSSSVTGTFADVPVGYQGKESQSSVSGFSFGTSVKHAQPLVRGIGPSFGSLSGTGTFASVPFGSQVKESQSSASSFSFGTSVTQAQPVSRPPPAPPRPHRYRSTCVQSSLLPPESPSPMRAPPNLLAGYGSSAPPAPASKGAFGSFTFSAPVLATGSFPSGGQRPTPKRVPDSPEVQQTIPTVSQSVLESRTPETDTEPLSPLQGFIVDDASGDEAMYFDESLALVFPSSEDLEAPTSDKYGDFILSCGSRSSRSGEPVHVDSCEDEEHPASLEVRAKVTRRHSLESTTPHVPGPQPGRLKKYYGGPVFTHDSIPPLGISHVLEEECHSPPAHSPPEPEVMDDSDFRPVLKKKKKKKALRALSSSSADEKSMAQDDLQLKGICTTPNEAEVICIMQPAIEDTIERNGELSQDHISAPFKEVSHHTSDPVTDYSAYWQLLPILQELSSVFGGGFPLLSSVLTYMKVAKSNFDSSIPEEESFFKYVRMLNPEEDQDEIDMERVREIFDGHVVDNSEEVVDILETAFKDKFGLDVRSILEEKQHEDGFFDEPKFVEIFKNLLEVVSSGGISSLGVAASSRIQRAICTAAFLLCMLAIVADEIKELPELRMEKVEPPVQLKMIAVIATTLICISGAQFSTSLFKALKYIHEVDEKHPLVYSSLNLGKNWEHVIWKYMPVDDWCLDPMHHL